MTVTENPTILTSAHFDADGVVAYRHRGEGSRHLVYAVAQQAMLGKWFRERCMEGAISVPYAEFVDIDLLPSPNDDPIARAAADWLLANARPLGDGGVAWFHDFDFVYTRGDQPIRAPWLSGIGQANALLACLHWWRRTGEERWRDLASRAVVAFTNKVGPTTGVAFDLGEAGTWFEEYPTLRPSHILNCHLLALVALQRASAALESQTAAHAFEAGFSALRRYLTRYDLEDWSRYDQYDRLFVLLRMIPSKLGTVAVGGIRLRSATGDVLAELDGTTAEPCDDPASRLGGIDWGPVGVFGGRRGRAVPNRQEQHAGEIPHGGTDQNTYLIFEERCPSESWIDSGLRLELDVFLGGRAELSFEARDLREEGLMFRPMPQAVCRDGEGWRTHAVAIRPGQVGRPVPRHYHRFQTELLGALLSRRSDPRLEEIFRRWHSSDFFDVPAIEATGQAPKTVYAFVNDRCGLKCKMCDIGAENRGVEEEALLGSEDRSLSGTHALLRPSLSLNMTDRGRDLNPEILIAAVQGMGDAARGALLQVNGTEPLLYPEYPELLRAARRAGMRTGITTSGIVLKREATRLAEAGVDQLFLSMDGPPAIHDEIRGIPGLFTRVLEGVDALDKACATLGRARPTIVVSFAVTFDNHLHVLEFLEAVRSIRPASVILNHLNFVSTDVARRHNERFPDYAIGPSSLSAWEDCRNMDFLELFRQIEIARRTEWTEVCVIPHCPTPTRLQWYYTRPELPMSRPRCEALQACVQVRTDGTIAALGRCFSVTMGDLNSQKLSEVWDGRPYQELRRLVREQPFLEACMRCCGSL